MCRKSCGASGITETVTNDLDPWKGAGGYLLRTKLRGAIELLDQLYQYGEVGNIRIGRLDDESLEEELPDLPEEEPES